MENETIKNYHLKHMILKELMCMSLEQIIDIKENFKKKYEKEYDEYIILFNIAIGRKKRELVLQDISLMIENYKNTPPDVAASSEVK